MIDTEVQITEIIYRGEKYRTVVESEPDIDYTVKGVYFNDDYVPIQPIDPVGPFCPEPTPLYEFTPAAPIQITAETVIEFTDEYTNSNL